VLALLPVYLNAQAALQITSPSTGTVVNPGQTIQVIVTASQPFTSMLLVGQSPLGLSQPLVGPPYSSSVTIPPQTDPGPHTLTALGSTSSGGLVPSVPVVLDVERPDSPVSVRLPIPAVELQVGGRFGIQVVGTYADGSTAYLSKSTLTTYSSQAPAVASVSGDGLVTALSPGSAIVLVNGNIPFGVTVDPPIAISPAQRTLVASQTGEFLARVKGQSTSAVAWSINPAVGSVDTNGIYTAPPSVPSPLTVTLTATSVANPGLTASTLINLSAAASISVVPAYDVLYPNQPEQFAANASNAGTDGVLWSVSPPGSGTISGTGLYTAPASISSVQAVTITATSVDVPSLSGSTTIYISPQPFALFTTPLTLTLGPGTYSGISAIILSNSGFTHPVAFSVTGLPSGVTATFDQPTVVGAGTANLTLTASASVAQGKYPLTVVATDTVFAPLSRSQPLTLNIGGGFSLVASTPTITTVPGSAIGILLTEFATSGFNTPILWGASTNGSPITATFPAAGITSWQQVGPGSSTFLLSVPASTPPGSYPVTITGLPIGGGETSALTVNVVVQSQTGPAAVSMSPNPGTDGSQAFTLAYTDPSGPASITSASVLVNATPLTASACDVQYSPATQLLSLRNDADTGWVGSVPIGTPGMLVNSQCAVDTVSSQATISGNQLLLTVVLTQTHPAVGYQNIFANVSDASSSSGWGQIGVWGIAANSVPSPWRDQDIGGPGPFGSGEAIYTAATGNFQIFGTSNNPNSTPDPANDWFRYVYQPLAGNGSIVARVSDLNNVYQYTSAGLMIRATPAQNSPFVYLSLQPNNGGCTISYRSTAGAPFTASVCTTQASAPVWLMLARQGSTFTAQTSTDGVTWTSAGPAVTVAMPTNVQQGMAVFSNVDGNVSWADFTNVSITSVSTTPAAAPTLSPSGGTYSAGQTVTISTTTLNASIRYTTDGSTPSETAGILYTGPFKVSTITTIKAIAYASGFGDSVIASAAYLFNPTVTFTGASASAAYLSTFTVATTTNASTTATIAASGPCSLAGNVVTITAGSGTCQLTASWAADQNYLAATATQTIVATKAAATVTLNPASLTQTYSAIVESVTATTSPAGLAVSIAYNGSATAPISAGSYAVVATINDPNYQGSANGSLVIAKAQLTVTANSASRIFNTANPTFAATYAGFAGADMLATAVTGSPSLTTTATTTSLPGSYPITAALGTLAAANYTFAFVNGTLTVTATGAAPSSGATCNGAYTGTFNGNVTVSSSQICVFVSGGISGNITLNGSSTFSNASIAGNVSGAGSLTLTGASRVSGNVTLTSGQFSAGNGTAISGGITLSGGAPLTLGSTAVAGSITMSGGGPFVIGPSATVSGNITVQSEPSSATQSQICASTIKGNVTLQSDAGPMQLGSATCGGNTISGNATIQSNTGAVGVYGNTISGILSCQTNTSIAGSGNKAAQKTGQCAGF